MSTDPIATLRATRVALEEAEAHHRGLQAQVEAAAHGYRDAVAEAVAILGEPVPADQLQERLEALERQLAADTETLAARVAAVRATIDKETK